MSQRPAWLDRLLRPLPPGSGAAVMGNGAVSTALILDGKTGIANTLLFIGLALWLALASVLGAAALFDRARIELEARHVAALSWPAGTFVLGTHMTLYGWSWAGIAMLSIGGAFWAALIVPDLRRIPRRAPGTAFLGSSATFTFAVLACVLGTAEGVRWLPLLGLALIAVGLGLYGYALTRFDFGQLRSGLGAHWVPGGSLATASFACGELRRATIELGLLSGIDPTLEIVDLVIWHLAILWLPVFVVFELAYPRLEFSPRRWGTVYALGVFAASSLAVGSVEGRAWIEDFGEVWVWVAAAGWALVLIATVRRAPSVLQAAAEEAIAEAEAHEAEEHGAALRGEPDPPASARTGRDAPDRPQPPSV